MTRGEGELNSQFGTKWITNGSENKKIMANALVPNGWKFGRVMNTSFNHTEETKLKLSKKQSEYQKTTEGGNKQKKLKERFLKHNLDENENHFLMKLN